MNEKEKDSDSRGGTAPGPQSQPQSQPQPQQGGMATFPSAYAEFAKRVEQSKGQLQQRCADEYLTYGNAIAAAQRDVDEALRRSAARYADDVKEALAPNELAERTMQAYRRLAELLEQSGKGEQLQLEAGKTYANFVQSLSPMNDGADAGQTQKAYLAAVDKVVAQGETLKQAAQAHAEYLALLRQLHKERGQRLQDAYVAYATAINEMPKTTGFAARADAAAEAAMTALHQAWRQASEEYDQVSADALKAFRSMTEEVRTSRSKPESH